MNELLYTLIGLLTGVIVGGAIAMALKRKEIAVLAAQAIAADNKVSISEDSARTKLSDAYEEGKALGIRLTEERAMAYTLQIDPYVRTTVDKGIFKNNYNAVVGYQSQLLINGVPALTPHITIKEQLNLTELNQETFDYLTALATKAAEFAIESQTGQIIKKGRPVIENK